MSPLRGLLVCAVLAGLGGRATACINDNESPAHEREFRSQYGGRLAGLPSTNHETYRHPDRHDLLLGGGAFLLIGSFMLATKRVRSRA
jgi:hypothetical protein